MLPAGSSCGRGSKGKGTVGEGVASLEDRPQASGAYCPSLALAALPIRAVPVSSAGSESGEGDARFRSRRPSCHGPAPAGAGDGATPRRRARPLSRAPRPGVGTCRRGTRCPGARRRRAAAPGSSCRPKAPPPAGHETRKPPNAARCAPTPAAAGRGWPPARGARSCPTASTPARWEGRRKERGGWGVIGKGVGRAARHPPPVRGLRSSTAPRQASRPRKTPFHSALAHLIQGAGRYWIGASA